MVGSAPAAAADGYAVPAFCIWNAETMIAVLSVAADLRSPVILMSGPGEFPLLPPARHGGSGRAVARRFNVRAAFHLDHGNSLEQVEELPGGRLHVGDARLFLAALRGERGRARQVVEWARPAGVTVEGEIGHVGKADLSTTEGQGASTLTEVAEAVAYAAETQVDALAISFGNAHGHYPKLPQLDFERLAAIHTAAGIPIVLHGGSGIPEADLRRAISLGIAKVNVATDLVAAQRESLLAQWKSDRNLWTPTALTEAVKNRRPRGRTLDARAGAAGRA